MKHQHQFASALAVAAATFVSAPVSQAQAPLLVVDETAGPYFEIQSAIGAASDGDFILVRTGNYTDLVINGKALTIFADRGADIEVDGTISITGLFEGDSEDPRQDVLLRGIKSDPAGTTNLLCDNGGEVWIEDCTFVGSNADGLLVEDCTGGTTLVRTLMSAGGTSSISGNGLTVDNSAVSVYESFARGFDQTSNLLAGGHGALVGASGDVFAQDFTAVGGTGADGVAGPPCEPGSAGGDGVRLSASATHLRYFGSAFTAGIGGAGAGGCSAGSDGADLNVLGGTATDEGCVARGTRVKRAIVGGGCALVEVSGVVGDSFILYFAGKPDPVPSFYPTVCGRSEIAFLQNQAGGGTLTEECEVFEAQTTALSNMTARTFYIQTLFGDGVTAPVISSPSSIVVFNTSGTGTPPTCAETDPMDCDEI